MTKNNSKYVNDWNTVLNTVYSWCTFLPGLDVIQKNTLTAPCCLFIFQVIASLNFFLNWNWIRQKKKRLRIPLDQSLSCTAKTQCITHFSYVLFHFEWWFYHFVPKPFSTSACSIKSDLFSPFLNQVDRIASNLRL